MKTLDIDLLETVHGGSALKLIGTGAALGGMLVAPFIAGTMSTQDKLVLGSAGVGWGAVAGWAMHGIKRLRRG